MRIATRAEGFTTEADLNDRVGDRLRLAFGSLCQDVRRVHVRFDPAGGGVRCAIRVHLRGRRTLDIVAEARTWDEALGFGASRAGAAVSRRLDNDRSLGRG